MKKYLKKIKTIILISISIPIILIIVLVLSIVINFYFNAIIEDKSLNNKYVKLFKPESKLNMIYSKSSLTGNIFYAYNYNELNYIFLAELKQYSKVNIKDINVVNKSLTDRKYFDLYKILIGEYPLFMIHYPFIHQFQKINIYNRDRNNITIKNDRYFYDKFYLDNFSLSSNDIYYDSYIELFVDVKSIEVLFLKLNQKTILIMNYRIKKNNLEDSFSDISLLDLINFSE
jgi:hypothetical protein